MGSKYLLVLVLSIKIELGMIKDIQDKSFSIMGINPRLKIFPQASKLGLPFIVLAYSSEFFEKEFTRVTYVILSR